MGNLLRIQTSISKLLLSAFLSQGVFAQHTQSEKPPNEIPNSSRQASENFYAMLNLTDILRSENLQQALTNAQQSLTLAEDLGNSNFAIVAKMDIASIQALEVSGQPNYPRATELINLLKLPSDAENDLQCHFYMAKFETRLWQNTYWKPSEIIHELSRLEILVGQSHNSELKNRFNTYSLFTRAFHLSLTVDPNSVDMLQEVSKQLSFVDGRIISILLAPAPNCPEERLQNLQKAKLFADKTSNRRLQFFIEKQLGNYYRLKKNWEFANNHYNRALQLGRELNALSCQRQALLKLSLTERDLGNELNASIYYMNFLALQKLSNDPLLKDRILRLGQEIQKQAGNTEVSSQVFAKMRLPRTAASPLADKASNVESFARKLTEQVADSKFQNEEQVAQLNSMGEKFSQEVFSLRRSHKIIAWIALLGGVMFYFVVRGRLNARQATPEKKPDKNRDYAELDVRVARMERMESLGLLAGRVAHDFNNILVGVLGNAEVIQMANDKNQDEFTRDRVLGIIKSAEKAANLSKQMLVCAGKTLAHRNWVDINRLVTQYTTDLAGTCNDDQKILFQFEEEEIFVNVDAIQIEQATLNLVSNAIQASEPGGTIVLRTGTTTIDSADDTSLFGTRKTGGKFCYIEVIDEGCGISTINLERIFEPFFSDTKFGRGLGLSVVYGVVESHNGFIKCTSSPGEKTTFKILLPLDQPIDENSQSRIELFKRQFGELVTSTSEPKAENNCVLVIDDAPSVRDLTSQILLQAGFCPITATNGSEGLEIMADQFNDIFCVLLDIMMPEMPADEVLDAMAEKELNIPVIVMTGFNGREKGLIETHSHVVQIVRKPFRAKAILDAVNEISLQPDKVPLIKSTL